MEPWFRPIDNFRRSLMELYNFKVGRVGGYLNDTRYLTILQKISNITLLEYIKMKDSIILWRRRGEGRWGTRPNVRAARLPFYFESYPQRSLHKYTEIDTNQTKLYVKMANIYNACFFLFFQKVLFPYLAYKHFPADITTFVAECPFCIKCICKISFSRNDFLLK